MKKQTQLLRRCGDYDVIFDICYGFSMALSLSENNQYFFNEINQSYSFSHLSDMYVFLSYIFCEKADGKKYVEEGLRLPKTESGGGRSFHQRFLWTDFQTDLYNQSCVLSYIEYPYISSFLIQVVIIQNLESQSFQTKNSKISFVIYFLDFFSIITLQAYHFRFTSALRCQPFLE